MAKRKRLSAAILTPDTQASETASSRPPIAHVAGAAADQAGLAEVARVLTEAREEGRLIQRLPLCEIETGHLVRDRIAFDAPEMESLRTSLAARGQQVPIEVVARPEGGYGLISGLRRVMALRELGEAQVLAIIRQPESSAAAYLAMVEENEIRAGISFYERARLASEAARLGLYPTAAAAIAALFGNASAAKRSKIGSFVRLHEAVGPALRFPAAIPERLGLALAGALETSDFAQSLAAELVAADPGDAPAERAVLEACVAGQGRKNVPNPPVRAENTEIAPGLVLTQKGSRLTLSGKALTPELQADLEAWLRDRLS